MKGEEHEREIGIAEQVIEWEKTGKTRIDGCGERSRKSRVRQMDECIQGKSGGDDRKKDQRRRSL